MENLSVAMDLGWVVGICGRDRKGELVASATPKTFIRTYHHKKVCKILRVGKCCFSNSARIQRSNICTHDMQSVRV
jgi:hypothetical protein